LPPDHIDGHGRSLINVRHSRHATIRETPGVRYRSFKPQDREATLRLLTALFARLMALAGEPMDLTDSQNQILYQLRSLIP
jgi:hypothetical protein